MLSKVQNNADCAIQSESIRVLTSIRISDYFNCKDLFVYQINIHDRSTKSFFHEVRPLYHTPTVDFAVCYPVERRKSDNTARASGNVHIAGWL